MNLSIDSDYLILKTDRELSEPYLTKTRHGDYRAYWHFVRDLLFDYGDFIEITDEIKTIIRSKVDEVRNTKKILYDNIDIEKYSKYFCNDLKQYPFQAKAVEFIIKQKKVLLADDMGLGKSVQAITVMLHLIETEGVMKFLVVVPASLRRQWLSECRKFINRKMFPDIELIINDKSKGERHYVYKNFIATDNPVILITSYDLIRHDSEKIKELASHVNMIILDEAQKIKTRKTKINKVIRKLFMDTEYKLAMTATPIENGLEDLYCICEFLDSRRLRSKTYFEKKYCIVESYRLWHRNINILKVVGYKNIKDVKEKLAGMYIRRTVDNVSLELPDIIKQNITLQLTDRQRRMYDEITGKIYGEMTRDDILGQFVKLQEVCDSTELLDAGIKSSVKLEELKRLVNEDLKYCKIVIISYFKTFAKIIKKELKTCNPILITSETNMEKRELFIKDFNNNPDRRILIGTEAIQEGLNLQVASILINVDLPWNPSKYFQRIGRIRRINSEHNTVRIINLITEETMEQHILEVLYAKGELFEKMFHRDEDVKIGSLLGMSKEQLLGMM